MLFLEDISQDQNGAAYDKYVMSLFEKNLAVEGAFEAEAQRFSLDTAEKVKSSEAGNARLRLVVSDDKVDEVMQALDAQNLPRKSTDFKLSPLLKGKTEYLKWQQSSATAKRQVNRVRLEDDLEEEDFEDIPAEE